MTPEPRVILGCVIAMMLGALATPAQAIQIDLKPPGEREFVRDLSQMIEKDDGDRIREICGQLLTDKATPILVVTIDSMAKHGGKDLRIETFARLLFDQWGIGHAELNGKPWNTGILLLVSRSDRKARIELGSGWKRDKDAEAARIMDDLIIPRFKAGDFSGGILAGVEGLDALARELKLPSKPIDWKVVFWWGVAIAIAIFTAVSLYRRGSSGWAWLAWGVVFTVVGYLLYTFLTSSGSGRSGGGFGGGSFGGGFSGGGGATGSW